MTSTDVSGDGRDRRPFYKRRILAVPAGALALVLLVLFGFWLRELRPATKMGGQHAVEPFRIAGNLYYVGANDVAAFLVTGPNGHIVLDAGYPSTARMIIGSITSLGFDIRDVKILLNSEPHPDHAGGLAMLQEASGAAVWASEASADSIAAGGDDPDFTLPMRWLIRSGLLRYPAPRVDRRIKDGDVVRLGPVAMTAHVLGGHSRGCTSWSFPVQDGDRVLDVVSVCDPGVLGMLRYEGQDADRRRSLEVLRKLPADIWVTNHARPWGRYRKFVASRTAPRPATAFIDPAGYRAYLDAAEADLRSGRVH
ncbi:MAG TPA: metallo-beta-lactamase [Luteitalea sp.]|nr:metallo-beta-lactamase [Luteitalea sp.]